MTHDMASIAGKLRQAGFRVTPQRQLILDAVCALGGHVTPEAVYEKVQAVAPTLNRATVYRVLRFLAEQRILATAQLDDGRFAYEIAGPEPHHHLVCRSCHASLELPHSTLQNLVHTLAEEYQFVTDEDHLTFYGRCAACYEA